MKSQRDLMVINDDKAKLQLHNDKKNDSKSTSVQQTSQQQYQADLILNSISISIVHFIKVIFSKINGIVMTNAKHSTTNVKTSLFVFLFFSLVVMSSSRKIPVHQLESFCR